MLINGGGENAKKSFPGGFKFSLRPIIMYPGVTYLFSRLPRLLILPAVVYIACTLFHVHIQTWVVLLSVLSLPVVPTLSVLYTDYINHQRADALGAVLPPLIPDKWPGGFSHLKTLVGNFKRGHPGGLSIGLFEKYGNTFRMKLLFDNWIITTEPEHVKAILATQFDSFEKGSVSANQLHSLLGKGVFNSDGEMWKFHRNMTRPFFNKERVSDFEIFGRHADDAIRQLQARLREGHPVDVQDLASRFTLDTATEFLFGRDVRSLSAGLPYPPSSLVSQSLTFLNHSSNNFSRAFAEGQSNIALRARFGIHWPIREFWEDIVKRDRVTVDEFIDPILNEALVKNKAEKEDETLLDHLVKFTNDPTIIKDEIVNITVAGRDTTATTITFATYMLAEHPTVLDKLRNEILATVGHSRYPTYDDLREMKYMRAFINEVLRLYPPVPFNSRRSNKETVFSSISPGAKPIYIPARTKCSFSVFFMHRRKDLWGPDALEFDPERFLDDRLRKYQTPNPFIFLPFNAGPRICLGQQFAYHETSFFLIRLLQNFSKIALSPEAQPSSSHPPKDWAKQAGFKEDEKIWPASHLTMYVREGLWVRMEEANSLETQAG